MANLALKKITDKAKILYRTGKYKKWTDAIKAASKVGDYKINKATFVEKNIPTSPRKKTTKKPKSFIVKRDTSGQFSKIKRIPNIGGLDQLQLINDTAKQLDNYSKEIDSIILTIKNTKVVNEKKTYQLLLKNRRLQFNQLKKYFNTLAKFK